MYWINKISKILKYLHGKIKNKFFIFMFIIKCNKVKNRILFIDHFSYFFKLYSENIIKIYIKYFTVYLLFFKLCVKINYLLKKNSYYIYY